jgi:hypothetical protein
MNNLNLIVLLLHLSLLTNCQSNSIRNELGQGSHLLYEKGKIVRLYCPDKKCLHDMTEHIFSLEEITKLLDNRINFEIVNYKRYYEKKGSSKVIKALNKYKNLKKQNLLELIEDQANSGFQNKFYRDLIFASTDSTTMIKPRFLKNI